MDTDGMESPLKSVPSESVQTPNVEDGKGGGELLPTNTNTPPVDDGLCSEQEESNVKDRRSAKSLPVSPDHATFLEEMSQGCVKRVQFADTLGLNLAYVKHFNVTEDPHIPSKVLSRFQSYPPTRDQVLVGDLCDTFASTLEFRCLVPSFKMPVDSVGFDARVRRHRVALEKVNVTHFDIKGIIRAMQMDCGRREVGVRYSLNDWLSFVDAPAVLESDEVCASSWEQFTFTLYTPPYFDTGSSVHFAVYCRTDRGDFWDNNEGHNYTLRIKST